MLLIYSYTNFLSQTVNKDYATKLEEVGELQATCLKELNHQRYRMSIIANALKRSEIL